MSTPDRSRPSPLTIRPLQSADIATITGWARQEGFAPGVGDVAIYRQTDRQGLWVGWLGDAPVGCIAGVRYNAAYGFIGLFLVVPAQRGRGYGLQLWRQALAHLADVPCIGLEAATDRIDNYAGWGFTPASATTRWQRLGAGDASAPSPAAPEPPWCLLEGRAIPAAAVQRFDAEREPSPRPHFLRQWLQHPAGTVLALMDRAGACHGFGRVRPCLLPEGDGWRLGPLVADGTAAAQALLEGLLQRHPGTVLIDAPGANAAAAPLLEQLGFRPVSRTLRMYRGVPPAVSLADVYGLACLELG
ncbi:GNAT family N-acetyltransferase [Synechococcus sp. BA-132 BA5]|uniref:GNAT family N-acetyltransferase n=1 Tax=Synechococcus sp. BA-132 BA5 TaxID=3110252 RepID=UPI002B1FD5E7|nr:GNAT family N-acetyltransferase [Synechococcus sp. BA-132 BA5]MEA5414922.1 GNAT family N-acetyltransferase [Synechococcus sp. BA-132 BA5]